MRYLAADFKSDFTTVFFIEFVVGFSLPFSTKLEKDPITVSVCMLLDAVVPPGKGRVDIPNLGLDSTQEDHPFPFQLAQIL